MSTDKTTLTRLIAIRLRCEQATPGPWHDTDLPDGTLRISFVPLAGDGGVPDTAPGFPGYALCAIFPGDAEMYEGEEYGNAAFIAHSRADVPWLLGRLDALEAALRRWVEADGGGGLHMNRCASVEGDACDCGLDAARALLAKE